jgi:23S rRNA pseudouridine1911/1915/1917 synthase
MAIQRIFVTADQVGARADVFVARVLGISRRAARALIEAGGARVAGRPLRKGAVLGAAEEVELEGPAQTPALVPDPEVGLPVVYADPALLVVDKPAGMPTHPLRPGERGSAANALVARFSELAAVGPPREGGAVHRLDAGTSGLLCFARTAQAYQSLRASFHEGRVEKEYLALCLGEPPESGACDFPIGHARRGASRARVFTDPRAARAHGALPAETRFRVLERFPGCALVQVGTHTGRTHQVRVHLAFLGFPLAGDALYQKPEDRARDPSGLARPFLHAAGLKLRHPETGQSMRFESPLPPDLRAVLAALCSR